MLLCTVRSVSVQHADEPCMHNRTQLFMINTLPAMTSHNVMKKEIEWSLLTCVTVNVIVLHC